MERTAIVTATDDELGRRSKNSAVSRRARADAKSVALESVVGVTMDWRFQWAALVRVSDNVVSRAVEAYDRIFGLDEEGESEIHLELGRKLVDEDRLDEAVRVLRNVIRVRPDHADALFELGKAQFRRGASRAAVEALEKAKAAGLKCTELRLLLADALLHEERLKEALCEIEAALMLEPDVADIHYRRATVLDHMERYAEAAEALENAIRAAPAEVRYYQSLGFTLESMGRRADAVRSFKRALELERARDLDRAAGLD
jgi:tetratricopeptide (TPR) repeat protein